MFFVIISLDIVAKRQRAPGHAARARLPLESRLEHALRLLCAARQCDSVSLSIVLGRGCRQKSRHEHSALTCAPVQLTYPEMVSGTHTWDWAGQRRGEPPGLPLLEPLCKARQCDSVSLEHSARTPLPCKNVLSIVLQRTHLYCPCGPVLVRVRGAVRSGACTAGVRPRPGHGPRGPMFWSTVFPSSRPSPTLHEQRLCVARSDRVRGMRRHYSTPPHPSRPRSWLLWTARTPWWNCGRRALPKGRSRTPR